MPVSKAIRAHQQQFLQNAKARTSPVKVSIEDVEIVVNPGVFPPATDTKLLAAHVKTSSGERIIDVTTGSGITAVIAGLQGATGFAVDINPAAVANAHQNLIDHQVKIVALESDLFSEVPPGKFDQIFANGPFCEGKIEDPMDYACYGARAFIEKLFSEAKDRLAPRGKLLIVVSEWSKLDHLEQTAAKNHLTAKVIATRSSNDGQRKYLLYEVKNTLV